MQDMTDNRAERNEEDADNLLHTDLSDNTGFKWDSHLKLDHCDLLLDAMDAQLDQLQVQPVQHGDKSRELDCNDAACRWSQSLSKDTGLGSTTQTNDTPMSFLELMHTPTTEAENPSGSWEGPAIHEGSKKRQDKWSAEEEAAESRREQVIWRLERLLGDTCREAGMAAETQPPSDSICTEDFFRRFSEEMVELTVPHGGTREPDGEEETDRTKLCDTENCQSEESKNSSVPDDRSSKINCADKVTTVCSQLITTGQNGQRKGYLSDCCGSNLPHMCGRSENRSTSLQNLVDDSCVSHRAEALTDHENIQHNNSCSPKARCLAGVPVLSFDTVPIDSDLDTICTEQVRQHIRKIPGWQSLIQCVTDQKDSCITQSDCDTLTQEESQPRSASVPRSSYRQNRSSSVRRVHQSRRETSRHVCSPSDRDTDEEINLYSGTSRSERMSQPDRIKMKARLSNLRQKCEKEEAALRLRRIQLREVERCLSDLRHKKKHALQGLERLAAKMAQMEKERRVLEGVLRDSMMEKESVCCELQKLQRQKESKSLEVKDAERDLAVLRQRSRTPNGGSCMNRNNVHVSVLERQEIEKQLDAAKTQLFTEQRRAREELESIKESLEETCEELQRATEAEKSLRNRCTFLEEKQSEKKDQIKALEVRVSKLQDELGENKKRVGTLEKMLAQKELQLLDSKEQCGAFQTEIDGQKGELQHLKTDLKEAQKQAQEMMVKSQAEEEKANDLKEQNLCITQHVKSMQSAIQLKEEEINVLRKSLQQQQEEAEKRKEEVNDESLQKVHEAVKQERLKWDAERVQQCEILEEQNRKTLESWRNEIQQERSAAQGLQHELVELKTKVQQLETERCAQQREQESLLAVICKSLKEEHQAEVQRLQTRMAQQSQGTVLQLQQDVQLAAKETDRLRAALEERESSHNRIRAGVEEKLTVWAQQLDAECQHLHLLVEQTGNRENTEVLQNSLTVAEALQHLKTVREQLKHFISHLLQELDSQRQSNELLRKDKERELSIQRQQLRAERDQAVNSIKEQLIQEHIEELSSLKWAHMSGRAADGGGAAASLRRQLRAKDFELQQVQRSMAQWKEQTAARLARKFEEELTAELERCKAKLLRGRNSSKSQDERKPQQLEVELIGAKEALTAVCSPCLHAVASAAPHSPSDVASLKLLRYLQSRVRQLRVENQSFMWRPNPSETVRSGSYLSTVMKHPSGQSQAGTSILTDSANEHQ